MVDFQGRILVIDDDLTTIKLIQRYLVQPNYRVLTSQSGAEGLRILAEEQTIHVILLDYMMPDMTGVEFMEVLVRQNQRPLLIMMSSLMEDQIPTGFRWDYFLKKPIARANLLDTLERCLAQSLRTGERPPLKKKRRPAKP